MKKFTYFILCSFFTLSLQAQEFCSDFGEGDFNDLCVEQFGPGTTGPMMSNALDIYDAGTGGAGADGIMDVQLTIESVVCASTECAPLSTSTGHIGGCIGGLGALGTTSDFASDFNAQGGSGITGPGGETTCINAGGYVCVTIDFLNGFSSTAMGFDLAQASNNGSSEGYQGSFGYVTAGTDINGTPLSLPTITLSDFCNYTNAQYIAGTTMSTFLGVTGSGTYQTDDLNAISNICDVTTAQDGEDTGSSTGASQSVSAATANPNLGLAPTDIITQVKHVYFYSSTSSTDCDGDQLTAANSRPRGAWTDVNFCFEALCNYTFEITDPVPDCGLFNIDLSNIVFAGVATGTYDVLLGTNGATPTTIATAVSGTTFTDAAIMGLTADGTTTYTFIIQESGNSACQSFPITLTAPKDSTPDCDFGGTFPVNPSN